MSEAVSTGVDHLPADFVAGNHFDKYGSRNPIHALMLGAFVRDVRELLEMAAPKSVLEVGCGAGELAGRLWSPQETHAAEGIHYVGTDVCDQQVARAAQLYPSWRFQQASAYELPFEDGSFDLVLACEVLEHLECPQRALVEAARVARRHLLVSVPWEPVWRVLNVARGKYWSRWGNTPGHVQHFSRRGLRRLVSERFDLLAERRPVPWTMLLACVRNEAASVEESRPS